LSIRELIIDWLTSSRYVRWLETRHTEQRQDYIERLAEKDSRIRELRTEVAGLKLECDRMRLVLMPLGSPVGAAYAERFNGQPKPPIDMPAFDGPLDWNAELNKMLKEDEDGLHGEGRVQEHESSANDGA